MQDLRWALLIIGGLVILGIYFFSLRDARRRRQRDKPMREAPNASAMDSMETINGHANDEPLIDAGLASLVSIAG